MYTQTMDPEITDIGKIVAAINLTRSFGKERGLSRSAAEKASVTLLDSKEESTWSFDPLGDNYRLEKALGQLLKSMLKGGELEPPALGFEAAKYLYGKADFLGAMLPTEWASESMVDYLERGIVSSYQSINQVKAIYARDDQATHKTVVLLSSVQYDRALMNRLLEIEYELHERFSELFLSFSYIPLLDQRKQDIIHPTFKLLFER